MLEETLREHIHKMYERGMPKRQIARHLRIDVKTVRAILSSSTRGPKERSDKQIISRDLLEKLDERCKGYKQRMREVLADEYNINIGYSTLTRLVRQYGIGRQKQKRCEQHPDIPGKEMQHDTSDYIIALDDIKYKLICAGLYFRYSKSRFIKFYHHFNRFLMKCFLHEALVFYGYSGEYCIIDNTSLAVQYGSGPRAVFNPEMVDFAVQYGFEWKAHEIGHANRKAGKERNFLTVQTNFLPGRRFKDLDDLNRQAFVWATEHFAKRPQSKTKIIPMEAFELEKPYLIKLPAYIVPPYQTMFRKVDEYGYASYNGNYYWTPEGIKDEVKLIRYEKRLEIYQKHEKLITYDLAGHGVKNQSFQPPGRKRSKGQPRNRKKGYLDEDKKLRALGATFSTYLDFVLSKECEIPQKPKFIRGLYYLSRKMERELLEKVIKRATEYKIAGIGSLERIARELILSSESKLRINLPDICEYRQRGAYQQGRYSCEEDTASYAALMKRKEKEEKDD